MPETDLAPTLRAVTKELQEHNRTLNSLRQELKPVLEGWDGKANDLLNYIGSIEMAFQGLLALSTKDAEQDAKRKEDIIQKAGEIVAARIDAWIASEDGQEALLGRLSDIADAWLAEERERLSKEREKDVAEPRSETE